MAIYSYCNNEKINQEKNTPSFTCLYYLYTFEELKMYTLLLTISLLHPLVICDEVKEETPDTIFLPYSETEDVDFTISRPSKIGCYQW